MFYEARLGEAHAKKPTCNTALNAKRQGAAKPMPDWARVASTRLSIGETSSDRGSSNSLRLLSVMAPKDMIKNSY